MHIQVAVVNGCHVVELAVLGSVDLGDGSVIVRGDGDVIVGVVASLVSVGVHRSSFLLVPFP